jgi:hypothetical protein
VNIKQEWALSKDFTGDYGASLICADDGATYAMHTPRAKRLVALWNAFLGVSTARIKKLGEKNFGVSRKRKKVR